MTAVEEAKSWLASAAPAGRAAGRPLAEAVAGFEDGLRRAADLMAPWRVSATEVEWVRCSSALEESARRAERLRLEAYPDGYEQLYGMLGDVMEPLDAFVVARDRLLRGRRT